MRWFPDPKVALQRRVSKIGRFQGPLSQRDLAQGPHCLITPCWPRICPSNSKHEGQGWDMACPSGRWLAGVRGGVQMKE